MIVPVILVISIAVLSFTLGFLTAAAYMQEEEDE